MRYNLKLNSNVKKHYINKSISIEFESDVDYEYKRCLSKTAPCNAMIICVYCFRLDCYRIIDIRRFLMTVFDNKIYDDKTYCMNLKIEVKC